jgi:glycosidase
MEYRFRIRLRGLAAPDLALDSPRRDFHVQKAARDELGFDDSFFTQNGDVVFPTLSRSQLFTDLLNRKQPPAGAPLLPAQVNAMGLLHEVFHAVIAAYKAQVAPHALRTLEERLSATHGGKLDGTLRRFIEAFPPPAVYGRQQTPQQYLDASANGVGNRETVLEELILLWLGNQNPAYAPIRPLISDAPMLQDPGYLMVIRSAAEELAKEPGFGPGKQSLLDLLLAPIRHAPDSLERQLAFMRAHWGLLLEGQDELLRLLLGLDFLTEEGKWLARRGQRVPQSHEPHLEPQVFAGAEYESEPERFSPDLDWMPKVVMLAKSTFVWLDQLGKQHGRPVTTLAEIPEAELDTLVARGYTALWLIGLWRRSRASQRIKQLNGNPDAVASAYSLYDYEIAPELGGHAAYENLRERCWKRGIRLASDMVPNHMGIDSSWVLEHPDWFLQTDHPPFPGHSFNGPNLCDDPRARIYIEDGYWTRTDAAVVFKRVDNRTGETRFIYHGNDGTSMPWNDTAQLDYLKAHVREAVIQTILQVARLFPIIRFDAAMTLAKRHYQRLWFPVPGTGGDIPSRAQSAMSREKFDELFPTEFWREVVDRVAREVPDTLLLAEAFWMMEGYFVRTLGMHRVYNSAFMNMLKKEENANYRTTLKNTLEFNPQILKRQVNFMNNPDEETAVAQFGKDDKYFGVTLLLATLPGLPMFGHGQVEGYTERYGMEYKRAYRDERPDEQLVARHMREIVPLLKKRWLFSDVEGFLLFDFVTPDGRVDEDVFAYANRKGDDRALILFHNKFKSTRGRIRLSASFLDSSGALARRTLMDGLGLRGEGGLCTVFRDQTGGLEYIAENRPLAEEGMSFELGAFKYRAFVDFREVSDDAEHPWTELSRRLAGAGVPSVADALLEHRLRPLHEPFRDAISPGSAAYFLPPPEEPPAAPAALRKDLPTPLRKDLPAVLRKHLIEKLSLVLQAIPRVQRSAAAPAPPALAERCAGAHARALASPLSRREGQLFLAVLFLEAVQAAAGSDAPGNLHLARPLFSALREAGLDEEAARRTAELSLLLAAAHAIGISSAGPASPVKRPPPDLAAAALRLLSDPRARAFLRVNVHAGTTWFEKERFEELARGLEVCAAGFVGDTATTPGPEAKARKAARATAAATASRPGPDRQVSAQTLVEMAAGAGYRLDGLAASLEALAGRRV